VRGSASDDRSDRVIVESIVHPGRTGSVDAAKYTAMREAVLAVLPAGAPGLTLDQAREAILPHLPQEQFPDGAKSGWWFKVVQLDLEAKGVIVRERVTPLRVHRVTASQPGPHAGLTAAPRAE
jgi:hypothetical protein